MPIPPAAPTTTRRRTLRENAIEVIRNAILTGQLEPGEVLQEAKLIEWLGISRTPIREALVLLCAERIVEAAPQHYTRVVKPAVCDLPDAVQALNGVMQIVSKLALPTFDSAARAELALLIREGARSVWDHSAATHLHAVLNLHRVLVAQCPNSHWRDIASRELSTLGFHIRAASDRATLAWDDLYRCHRELAASVATIDLAATCEWLAIIHSLMGANLDHDAVSLTRAEGVR